MDTFYTTNFSDIGCHYDENNNTLNFTCDVELPDDTHTFYHRLDIKVGLIVAYTFVFCCCFFGNLMVIIVVITHQKMRTVTNFFLANLAFADFCVGIFCVYQNLSIYLTSSWLFGDFMCKMYNFIQNMSYTASITILMVISIERYLAIIYPMKSKQILTLNRLKIVIVMVWLVSGGYNVPKLLMYGTADINDNGDKICIMMYGSYDEKMYDLVNFFLWYVSPIFFMTVMYSIIGIKLWKSSAVTIKSSGYRNRSFPMKRLFTCHTKSVNENTGVQAAVTFQNGKVSTLVDSSDYIVMTADERNSQIKHKRKGKRDNSSSHQDEITEYGKNTSPAESSEAAPNFNPTQQTLGPRRFLFRRKLNSTRNSDISMSNQKPDVSIHNSSQNVRARRRVIKLLVVIILIFALCLLPYHARKLWRHLAPKDYYKMTTVGRLFTPISFFIMYMNSGLNPIIYAFLSDNFRRSMRDVFCCRRRKSALYVNSEMTSFRGSSTLTHSVASLA